MIAGIRGVAKGFVGCDEAIRKRVEPSRSFCYAIIRLQLGDLMATEIIEGSIAPSEPVRSKRGYCLFDPLTITDKAGKAREFKKVSAGGAIAEAIRRGAKGKFYLGKNAGMAGIHGVRLDDGTTVYSKYHNFEIVLMIGVGAGLFMLIVGLLGIEGFMITPVIIGAALLVFLIIVRTGRIADQKAFENDSRALSGPRWLRLARC